MRIKIPRELAAKFLGLRSQPAVDNRWLRDIAPVELVKARYRADAEKVATAKAKRRAMPLGPTLVDSDGGLLSAAEFLGNP